MTALDLVSVSHRRHHTIFQIDGVQLISYDLVDFVGFGYLFFLEVRVQTRKLLNRELEQVNFGLTLRVLSLI